MGDFFMVDSNDMAQEYVKAYTDKSRIYFIEKYLTTFDGTEGRNVPFVLFQGRRYIVRHLEMTTR